MNDFLTWLYPRYIKPYLDEKAPDGPYEMNISLMESNLAPEDRENYDKAVAFSATESFLLGLRTGQGLTEAFSTSAHRSL